MDKRQLLKMAENSAFISGIYNYCDRWCERCAYTRRCMSYAMEKESFSDEESHDINNEKFWSGLHDSFRLTRELLQDFMEAENIALSPEDLDEAKKEMEVISKRSKENPLTQDGTAYSTSVTAWLTAHEQLFTDRQEELTRELELGIGYARASAAAIVNLVDVIRWYQDLIRVKLMRALDGAELDKEFGWSEEEKEFPSDSDGSAKVALIGIERSLGAWGELQKHLPQETDSIMVILIQLERLRKSIEKHFPQARRFVRPGFDQEV